MLRVLLPILGVAVLYYVWRHPDGWAGLAKLAKPLLYLALALLYVRSPIDLIPDTTLIGFIDDLLVLLAALYFGRPTGAGRTGPSAAGNTADGETATRDAGEKSPYQVLGVERGASQEEVTRAYREKMKQYHPDRVAGLGGELQRVAHEKSVEIQRAYDALRQR